MRIAEGYIQIVIADSVDGRSRAGFGVSMGGNAMGRSRFTAGLVIAVALATMLGAQVPVFGASGGDNGSVVPSNFRSEDFVRPPGTYRVQYIAVNDSRNSPEVTAEKARFATEAVDAAFDRITRGKYRFVFESFTRYTWTESDRPCSDEFKMAEKIGPTIPSVDNGIRVYVAACLDSRGEMPGDKVFMRVPFMRDPILYSADISTLAHELGHNLGLKHSGAVFLNTIDIYGSDLGVTRSNPYETLVKGVYVDEYGDPSTMMGGNWALPLSAYELDLLGVYEPKEVGAAIDSGSYTITERSKGLGARIIYIPFGGQRQAAVELWREPNPKGSGTVGGVIIRAIFERSDVGAWRELPDFSNSNTRYIGSAVLQPSGATYRTLTLSAGSRIDLPDKTSIVVEQVSEAEATFRISRSRDTTAPVISPDELPCDTAQSCSYTINPYAPNPGGWKLDASTFQDDRWLAYYGVKINGKEVSRFEYPSPATPQLWKSAASQDFGDLTFPLGAGTYEIEVFAVDLAGNRSTVTRSVTVKGVPTTSFNVSVATVSKTSATLRWSTPKGRVLGYQIFSRTGTNPWQPVAVVRTTKLTLKGLRSATNYQVLVTPMISGQSSQGSLVSFQTKP